MKRKGKSGVPPQDEQQTNGISDNPNIPVWRSNIETKFDVGRCQRCGNIVLILQENGNTVCENCGKIHYKEVV